MTNSDYNVQMTRDEGTATEPSCWPDGVGMIYLGMSPWDGMWRNRHQLMSRFAAQMPVLYVEPPMHLRKLKHRLLTGSFSFGDFRISPPRRIRDKLHVYGSSAALPVSGRRVLKSWSESRWRRAFLEAARQIGILRPILWISQPDQKHAIGQSGETLSIYHAVDEYAGYTGLSEQGIRNLLDSERHILDRADVTVVVSPELMRAKSGFNRDVRLVENAVDLRQFAGARTRNDVPDDLATVSGPRLGYCGLVGKRLNLQLINGIAARNPEWSFVFIGKVDRRECEAAISALEHRKNVFFLGEKKPENVADYVAGLDVGLLPYEINLETTHISPLKMYEYLAAGLPVVSTAIPAANRHAGLVGVARSAGEFESKCRVELSAEQSGLVEERMDFARKNTWDGRVTELTLIIQELLDAKGLIASTAQSTVDRP